MSNDTNVYERLWKLYISIGKMIMDGVRDPQKVADALQVINDTATVYLKRLHEGLTFTVSATLGTETFKNCGFFIGGVYGVDISDIVAKATSAIQAIVWEIILDGIFAQLFGSLGNDRKRWTQAQVIVFCRDHRDLLRTDGYGTFFELEGGFVACAYFDGDGRLEVGVSRSSYGCVWNAECWSAECRRRLVSLQQ